MKTTETDLDKVTGYLKSQVGWVPLDKIRKAIPPKHANAMKIEAMRHLGLVERDGENVKLTADGRDFAGADPAGRATVMRKLLKADALYSATLEWMHYNEKPNVTKNDVANYWHDSHQSEIGGAKGDALTDPAVFFMRMVGVAELGKFTPAGVGRDTNVAGDPAALEAFATGTPPAPGGSDEQNSGGAGEGDDPPPPRREVGGLNLGTGLNVNVEIHIAADAKPSTVEEIFKNMRKYLIDGPDSAPDGG